MTGPSTEPPAGGPATPHPRRRTFGPVVLLGLLAAAALATASTRPWFVFETDDPTFACEAPCAGVSYDDAGTVSSANALALVALACWGVVLVARGRFRRGVAWLGVAASVAAVVAVVLSLVQVPDDLRDLAARYADEVPDVGASGWLWVGAVAAVAMVATWAAAVTWARHWPEMGSRYDRPRSEPPEDLWKALDEGHDPTAGSSSSTTS